MQWVSGGDVVHGWFLPLDNTCSLLQDGTSIFSDFGVRDNASLRTHPAPKQMFQAINSDHSCTIMIKNF